ncbi:MAG TPA: hypothetical protein VGN96_19070 [Roseococcus sp.]|jgi:ribosome modulation factor|nr:hypothetical protein [Roseococcus sp.]
MPEAPPPNTISPNDFVSIFAEMLKAETDKDARVGKLRSIRARLEKAGCDMPAVDLVIKLRKLEPDVAEARLRNALRYARWLNMPIGAQPGLFSDDAGLPSVDAQRGLTEAQAYQEGHAAGLAGRMPTDCRFDAGTGMHARWRQGWDDGQAALGEMLGREPEEGETLKPEKRTAKPKGGTVARGRPRGRGGRGRDSQASA